MEKSKHTPGPWVVFEEQNKPGNNFNVYAEDGAWTIARCFNQEANARLIAAAPELLAALKTAAGALDRAGLSMSYAYAGDKPLKDIIGAAIAKAEGKV